MPSSTVSHFVGNSLRDVYIGRLEQDLKAENGFFPRDATGLLDYHRCGCSLGGWARTVTGAFSTMKSRKGSTGVRMLLGKADQLGTSTQRSLKKQLLHDNLPAEPSKSGGAITIPLSYYEVLGLQQGSSEEQILTAYLELKNSDIDEAYTVTAVLSSQEFLEDVKTRLLSNARHAKNSLSWNRSVQPPGSFISIPFAWLPGALALLQKVGEDEVVVKLGNAALQEKRATLYHHDIMLAVALSKCSKAKKAFEKSSIAEGFEELVQAHMLLKKGKDSLHDTKLVAEIEASLEEMAPACALEHLSLPCTLENKELRTSARAALTELIRQGLSGEPSCSVQNWENFLSQALTHLRADEICDLLPWQDMLLLRKQKENKAAQRQRRVLSVDCLYTALVAHIALGFSTRQPLLVEKAEKMAYALAAAEDVDVRIDQAVCAALLGHADQAFNCLAEGLDAPGQVSPDRSSHNDPCQEALQFIKKCVSSSNEYGGEIPGLCAFTEIWLKYKILKAFQDTHDCKPSLSDYYNEPTVKNYLMKNGGRAMIKAAGIEVKSPVPSAFSSPDTKVRPQSPRVIERTHAMGSRTVSGDASGSQEARVANLNYVVKPKQESGRVPSKSDFMVHNRGHSTIGRDKTGNVGQKSDRKSGNLVSKLVVAGILTCSASALALYLPRVQNVLDLLSWGDTYNCEHCSSNNDNIEGDRSLQSSTSIQISKFFQNLGSILPFDFGKQIAPQAGRWGGTCRSMAVDEAEVLIRHWQAVKAAALGPQYARHCLPEILADSMLAQWQALVDEAKAGSCHWRFVLLSLTIVRAEIITDELGWERAELEAILEEAAELVEDSKPTNPNYYSTYCAKYQLRRSSERTWRICEGRIESSM